MAGTAPCARALGTIRDSFILERELQDLSADVRCTGWGIDEVANKTESNGGVQMVAASFDDCSQDVFAPLATVAGAILVA